MPEDDLSNKIINNTANRIRRHMDDEAAEFYIDGELSDETKARYEAAFKADEDKPKFVGTPKGGNILKDILDGKTPKPPSLEDMLREQLEAGDAKPAEQPDMEDMKKQMDHIHELFEKNKDRIKKLVEDLGADEPWDLTKAEEAELTAMLKPLGEFITKHELPAMIRIQTGRVDGFEAKLLSLKSLPLLKVCPRLGLLIKISDILFTEALQKEEYEALLDLVFRISMAQRLRGE